MTGAALLDALPQWLAALGGVAGIGALFRIGIERRTGKALAARKEADATRVVTDTAVGLLDPLKEQVEFLRQDLTRSRAEAVALRDDVRDLHEYINLLIDVIEAAGLPIPPRPRPVLREEREAAPLGPPEAPPEPPAAPRPRRSRPRRERVE